MRGFGGPVVVFFCLFLLLLKLLFCFLIACNCFLLGVKNDGSCAQNTTGIYQIGQCLCKDNVSGRRCNQCVANYYGIVTDPVGVCEGK